MEKEIEVLCIGHAAYDLGMFVAEFPREDSKCEISEIQESCGGPAANAAYLLSSWGMRCGFAGLVGEDGYGRRIRDEFVAVGTDVTRLELRPGHVTPLSVILINKRNGSRTIVNRKRAGATMRLNKETFFGTPPRVLLFDGHELDASLAALSAYPNAISILDAGSLRDGTEVLAGRVNYLAASERFGTQATGLEDLQTEERQHECLSRLRGKFSTTTVVTLGERGLIMDDGAGFKRMPAFQVQVVDTTAAGDIFHGALAYAIAQDTPLWEGLRFASMAAALSVQSLGGRTSIPTLKMVREALAHAE